VVKALIDDRKGRGRKASILEANVARNIAEATWPTQGRNRWSSRSMAEHDGISGSRTLPISRPSKLA
jgi:hypothetical protein